MMTAPELVSIKTFRDVVSHLEQLVNVDYHACVGDAERRAWVDRARKVGSELLAIRCARRFAAESDRKERALDRSTKLIVKILGL